MSKFEVISNGKTVWVNDASEGVCVGCFREVNSCHVTLTHWRVFQAKIKELYSVDVPEIHKPDWVSE